VFQGLPEGRGIADNVILVMAVDSANARREVLDYFFGNYRNLFIVDAGNEDNFGQVKFFTDTELVSPFSNGSIADLTRKFCGGLPKMVPAVYPVSYIPFPSDHYANLGNSASEKSCAELDQTLSINSLMASMMCGVIQNFLYVKPMTYNEIRYSLNGGVSTVFNTPEAWFGNCIDQSKSKCGNYKVLFGGYIGTDESTVYKLWLFDQFLKMGLNLEVDGGLTPLVQEVKSVQAESKKKPIKKAIHVVLEESEG
jgi:hypothetical protein